MTHLKNNTCIQMFSGGRDSTLAAVRLARTWEKLVLVTVTTANLNGIERVRQRLEELGPKLRPNTEWLLIALPSNFNIHRRSATATCLTCHHVYLVAGAMIAEKYNSKHLALGYTGYQSTWTEQTPYAIERLTEVMSTIGLNVIFPVSDLLEKEQAIAELRANSMSENALEQKCAKQLNDPNLPFNLLRQEVDRWGEDLRYALANRQNISLDILDRRFITDSLER